MPAASSSASTAAAAPTAGTEAMTAWLTKNLHLVGSLTVDLAQIDEAAVAAALQAGRAATAGPSAAAAGSDPAAAGVTLDGVCTHLEAISLAEQQPAQPTTATAPLSAPVDAGQDTTPPEAASNSTQLGGPSTMQLSQLVLQGYCSGSLLLAVSGNTHLTRLDLCFTPRSFSSSSDEAAAVSALGSLRSLRDLKLGVCSARNLLVQRLWQSGNPTAPSLRAILDGSPRLERPEVANAAARKLAPLLPALQHLTQLSSLVLMPGCLTQCTCSRLLPPSLRQLTTDRVGIDLATAQEAEAAPWPLLDLAPLTAVTKLTLLQNRPALSSKAPRGIIAGDVLPPGLKQLHCLCDSLEPLLPLAEIESLHITCSARAVAQLPDLAAKSSLRHVDLSLYGLQTPMPEAAAAAVGQLPLKDLQLVVIAPLSAAALQHVPSWGRAQRLKVGLAPISEPAAVLGLVSQLQKVPKQAEGLQLAISSPVPPRTAWSEQDAVQLCQQLCQVTYVDSLDIDNMPLAAAAGQLAGATHLKRLNLVGCGVPAETAAALREQLHGAEVDIRSALTARR